ncbi:hypothetical protein PQ469_29805 [Mucilaginibacter sp. KACC 22773]|jgi:predicted signal transduction protein with EAL and GGDEF domain|uniref:hypothetical protein n=1 Tax=Mucilaginibacter sp. KACC 22773 TaxID=3025671 RepID=UPI002365B34F|nr:hypothetical protein [Mucilaginibacter sp. KACC 22773]WDF78082.1 hypothetical protein PQ469_29805 [Mucilaginibacter sp. KACC 22773]
MENLPKQIKTLKLYLALLTVTIIVCFGFIIRLMSNQAHFKQITAERIDIVEPDGKIRMAISNRQSQHPGTIEGKQLPKRDRPAGMIFFNDDGNECGGLVYDGDKKSASMTYSIDQYKNDQIMQLQYSQENNGPQLQRSYGLKLWDKYDNFPSSKVLAYIDSLNKLNDTVAYKTGIDKLNASGRVTKERLFVGKNAGGDVGLFLSDANGKPKLRIYINKQNQPVIETLDDKGAVAKSR